jgi:hypothetical protein
VPPEQELPREGDSMRLRRDVMLTLIAIPLCLMAAALVGLFHLLTQ